MDDFGLVNVNPKSDSSRRLVQVVEISHKKDRDSVTITMSSANHKFEMY